MRNYVADPERDLEEEANKVTFTQAQVDYLKVRFECKPPTGMADCVNTVVFLVSAAARSFGHNEMISHIQSLVPGHKKD